MKGISKPAVKKEITHDDYIKFFDTNKNESDNLIKEATQEIKTTNKFCADIDQIKHIFNEHIEPYYLPLLNMLPDDLQIMLNKETFAGLSTANYL